MQANAVDYASDVLANGPLAGINFLDGFSKGTHFFASSKYNADLFNYLTSFKETINIGNVAVSWYGSIYSAFDYIMAFGYIALFFLALFIMVEGIIRLATGTYPSISSIKLTAISFGVMTLFIVSSFITNFCTKYIAIEVIPEGETYVAKTCPLQYILWILLLICLIGQYWINVLLIKGKLYVADGRLIKKTKKDKEEIIENKKSRKGKKNKEPEVPVVEEVPVSEVLNEEPTPTDSPLEKAPIGTPKEEPVQVVEEVKEPVEEKPAEEVPTEDNASPNNAETVKKDDK